MLEKQLARERPRLTRELDEAVRQFHQAPLQDEWAYLFLDGVSLRMRRATGRQRVHMLVAYGVRQDGTRQLLSFMHSHRESQTAWEGMFEDLYRRGEKSAISWKKCGAVTTTR